MVRACSSQWLGQHLAVNVHLQHIHTVQYARSSREVSITQQCSHTWHMLWSYPSPTTICKIVKTRRLIWYIKCTGLSLIKKYRSWFSNTQKTVKHKFVFWLLKNSNQMIFRVVAIDWKFKEGGICPPPLALPALHQLQPCSNHCPVLRKITLYLTCAPKFREGGICPPCLMLHTSLILLFLNLKVQCLY